MKHLYILLSILIAVPFATHASHMQGGEITWKCLPNGQYQFYMKVYRECVGATFFFNNQVLRSNSPIANITLKPDSAEYLRLNGGIFSHVNAYGEQNECKYNSSWGDLQVFPFVSDPVTLNGIPSANGWEFYWSLCCRGNVDNLTNPMSESYYLRTAMYAFKNQNANSCFDSSPQFIDYPNTVIGVGFPYSFSNNAYDDDLDSLFFEYDDPLQAANTPTSWMSGYTKASPFPNSNQHPNNITVDLNSDNGHASGLMVAHAAYNFYTYCVRVDSYRKGIKIASIWRDMIMIAKPITEQVLNTSVINKPPTISLDGMIINSLKVSVDVEDKLSIPVVVRDTNMVLDDPNDPNSLRNQDVLLTATSLLFSQTYSDSSNCNLPTLSTCATLTPAPAYDSTIETTGLIAPETVSTLFEWQPNCDLLESWENQKTFDFVFSAVDDHFPTLVNYATLSIEVNRKAPKIVQNGNVLTVLDTGSSYQWFRNDTLIPNSDTTSITINNPGMYSLVLNGNTSCAYQKGFYKVLGCVVLTDTISVCESFVWWDGITYTESTTSPTYIRQNVNGCDTVVKLNLTIKNTKSTDYVNSCGSFKWIDGNTYTQSTNTPQFVMTNSAGCDSIITLHLEIPEIDNTTSRVQNTLSANQNNAIYQWLDCDNGFSKLQGETNQSFSPSKNGVYACIVKMDGCADTTSCNSFYFIGLEEHFAESITIYPNPTSGNFKVQIFSGIIDKVNLRLMDMKGRDMVVPINQQQNAIHIETSELSKGIYFLNVEHEENSATFKIVKL